MASIEFEAAKGVGIIRLNRPEKLNAFDREMSIDLQKILDECATNKVIRSVYLTGTGKAFSAGQDLSEVIGKPAKSFSEILTRQYNPIIKKIRHLEKPVVAAVNGVAAGAGANIALCCDVVLAAVSASFVQAFSRIGLIPDSGGSFFLPRLIGWQKASALTMLGDKISAMEAERIGMVYKVLEDDHFAKDSLAIAESLANMPTRALGLTKHAFNQSITNNLEQQLALEDILQQQAAQTSDYQEGVSAFIEKRQASFKGE